MAGKRPPGRPSKLTDERQTKIVEAVKKGNYIEIAARAAGIDPTTYYRWMEQGEADEEHDKDTPHRAFREAVIVAAAEAETTIVGAIRDAVPTDWRAGIEILKRRHPDRWRDRSRVDVEQNAHVQAEVEVVHNKPVIVVPAADRREEVARILAEAMGQN